MKMSARSGQLLTVAMIILMSPATYAKKGNAFSDNDKRAIQAFWKQSGRYFVDFQSQENPYQGRLTPEGSVWLYDYAKKISPNSGKMIPGADLTAQNDRQKVWNDWIEKKYSFEESQAEVLSHKKSLEIGAPGNPLAKLLDNPGAAPADLVKFAGEPPTFVRPVIVRTHNIQFEDIKLELTDNVKVRRKYAYFRFNEGVMHSGTRMSGKSLDELKPLFSKAGVDESQLKVMAAVSLLEGGFDSLNTYDTGYVSVGFIQFACLKGGAGSLGQVMLTMKQNDAEAFNRDFRRYGLDVTEKGELIALKLDSLDEMIGPDAALQVIKDVRLAAVFQRAGRVSPAFRESQITTALNMYYPANDPITVKVGSKTYTGSVNSVIKTEAGMATLMDRKVNTGSLGNLESAVAAIMASYKLSAIEQVAEFEQELVNAMRYRKSYLSDPNLTKPKASSRSASRGKN